MKISFWGTRGSIASPGPDTVEYGGNTTCVEVRLSSGRTVVIDAGTGIRSLGSAMLELGRPPELTLLMTHVHWDHVLGFPFFLPVFQNNCHIVVDGFRRAMDGLRRVFSTSHLDGTWPVRFEDLKARIEPGHLFRKGLLSLDDTLIQSHPLQHPQGGLGFKFTEASGSFVFLTDNELIEDAWVATSFKEFVAFCRDADLLVHDCQYFPEEAKERRGWGHSDTETVCRLAIEAGVKKLILFHHDPWRTDGEVTRMVSECRKILQDARVAVEVDAAREGSSLIV